MKVKKQKLNKLLSPVKGRLPYTVTIQVIESGGFESVPKIKRERREEATAK